MRIVMSEDAHGYESRGYGCRCVEAWTKVLPWTGLPINRLIDLKQTKSNAQYVRC